MVAGDGIGSKEMCLGRRSGEMGWHVKPLILQIPELMNYLYNIGSAENFPFPVHSRTHRLLYSATPGAKEICTGLETRLSDDTNPSLFYSSFSDQFTFCLMANRSPQ